MTLLKPITAFLFFSTVFAGLSACYESDTGGGKTKDCSVSARCEGQPNLDIRLRQVETYYYENALEPNVSYTDLAQFYYDDINNPDHWTGGRTFRAILDDFEYSFSYDLNHNITSSNRLHTAEDGSTANVLLTYNYNLSNLHTDTVSETSFKNPSNVETKTIDETITYNYSSGILIDINFDGYDSGENKTYSFDYEFTYFGNLITQIEITNDTVNASANNPDYTFKTFQYDNDNKLISSKTYGLDNSNQVVEIESITYQYYLDGPLKSKTIILTDIVPQQKIVARYVWESGSCRVNQIFGDRLYPTPEISNFPCL